MVAPRSRVFASDEELGKRDDDRKPPKMPPINFSNRPALRKRRIFLGLLACLAVWAFIHYIPTDLGPMDRHRGVRLPPNPAYGPRRAFPPPPPNQPADSPSPPSSQTPGTSSQTHPTQDDDGIDPLRHDYSGPIKFYYLASTLRAAQSAGGSQANNKHVVFAAADLTAAASLLPIACQMATWRRNFVHLAIMGRSDFSIEDIQQINGVSSETCTIFWHDARPDFGISSTDTRMEVSVAGALGHIDNFIHPGVIITTDLESDQGFFARGLQRKLKHLSMTHIQVPKARPDSLAWLSRLDAYSIKAWHSAAIDILIQAPLDSSGSLTRLLKSIAEADYTGFSPPRLTIELPHKIDALTQKFLSRFKWPPNDYAVPGQNEQLIIRRRIFEQRASVDEASHRFIESFYPNSPNGPHVLLLSPQAELSPVYFHYLKLHMLEYRHSSDLELADMNLLGISLDSPTTQLDGIHPFQRPLPAPQNTATNEPNANLLPFRWQAPNSNAALYFADKWIEIHHFLTKRRSASRQPSLQSHFKNEKKFVSQKYPAWMEYMLQLMQNRGSTMLYPSLQHSSPDLPSDSLVIVHNELYQVPEEFAQQETDDSQARTSESTPSADGILTVKDDYLTSHHPNEASNQRILNKESPLLQSLDLILPTPKLEEFTKPAQNEDDPFFGGSRSHSSQTTPALPRLSTLPLLDYQGQTVSTQKLASSARSARMNFRVTAGGCTSEQSEDKLMERMSAADLFCFDDNEDAIVEASLPPSSSPDSLLEPANKNEEDNNDNDKETNDKEPQANSQPPPTQEQTNENQAPGNVPQSPQEPQQLVSSEKPNVAQPQPVMVDAQPPKEPQGNPPPAPNPAPESPIHKSGTDPAGKPASGPGSNSRTDGKRVFPVLDPSKIKAFDEGREAERDILADAAG